MNPSICVCSNVEAWIWFTRRARLSVLEAKGYTFKTSKETGQKILACQFPNPMVEKELKAKSKVISHVTIDHDFKDAQFSGLVGVYLRGQSRATLEYVRWASSGGDCHRYKLTVFAFSLTEALLLYDMIRTGQLDEAVDFVPANVRDRTMDALAAHASSRSGAEESVPHTTKTDEKFEA